MQSSEQVESEGGAMKDTLKPGIQFEFTFRIPESKTVPALYPEAPEFQEMPVVFATGFMVGFLEWACIKAINPHLDWPEEQTVGTHINVSHTAATPPGMAVTARVKLVEVEGRRLKFELEAFDEKEPISKGTHERFIINRKKFDEKLRSKTVNG
jgi:fluoroacetyl-CoA thioesterase